MKKLIFILGLGIMKLSASAQIEIKLENLKAHIGDTVKIQAVIYGGKYFENTKGSPTFLNVGAKYPNAPLTIVIWGNDRNKFKTAPEVLYGGGSMKWISGKIEMYKGKPEIVVTDPNQIWDVGN